MMTKTVEGKERKGQGEALPDGWQWVKLGNHVKKIGSGITPRGGHSVYLDSGVPLIRSQNVHMNRFELEGLAYISDEQDEKMEKTRVLPKDVLLNITGASIGRVCVVPDELCPANVNQHVSIIRSDGSFDPDFLGYYISLPDFQKLIMSTQAGATRQALTKSLIENFEIPLPPIAEQKRIVAILSDRIAAVDQARLAAQTQLAAAQALPAAYLRQIFDRVRADPDLSNYKLGELCNVVRGSSPRPQGDSRFYGGNVPRLMVADVTRDGIHVIPQIDFLTLEGAKLSRPMKNGDVVMVVSGAPGLPGILAIDACIHDGFVGFRELDTQKVSNVYLYYFLLYEKAKTDSLAAGAIFRNLTTTQIKNIDIKAPLLEKQTQIISRLEKNLLSTQELKKALQGQLDTINTLPAALLRQAFNGEL